MSEKRMYLRVPKGQLPRTPDKVNRMYFDDDTCIEFEAEQCCRTCAHWDRHADGSTQLRPCFWLGIHTKPEFGCVQWEQERG